MRPIALALTLSLLALPCAAQDAWTLDGKHVLVAQESGADEVRAKAAEKELAPWVLEQLAAAKSPQVFVVTPKSATALVAALGKAGHTLVERKGDLRAVSLLHAEVYDTLADYKELLSRGGDFRARREAQEEMAKRLRSQAGLATPIRDVLLLSKSKQEQVFLAGALGGIPLTPGHEAVLAVPDVAVVLTLTRALPEGAKTLALLIRAYPRQPETNCKGALLREIGKRIGEKGDGAFLQGVAADSEAPRALRAEAVTALGRRKNPKDFAVLAEITKAGALPLRQRAIVGVALSDGVKALPLLIQLCQDPETAIRASVVLALGRIGSQGAMDQLAKVAKNDASEAVRIRAQRLLSSLERRKKN